MTQRDLFNTRLSTRQAINSFIIAGILRFVLDMVRQDQLRASTKKTNAEAQVWYEFCTNTTIHGLKQIVEQQRYALRRLIWTVLVLTGLALFVYQMTTAIIYYYSYPISVNVKINYNESIRFPALTICNQNAFRKTLAAEHGWYFLLSDIFSSTNDVIDLDLDAYNASGLSLYDMFDRTGHDKRDLIVRCIWDGQPCSVDNFVMTMTDYGRCYTYNADAEERELVWRTGAEGGLCLLLKVEQYEYMPGPNQGAGVRVHVHDQQEIPLMKEFGIAVAPGSHSLMGMTMIRVENLPRPHGVCDDNQMLKYFKLYTKKNCIQECRQSYVESRCNCRHINMENNTGEKRFCSLDEYQSCALRTLSSFNLNNSACNCPIPCQIESFNTFTSVSKISEFDALNLLNSPLTPTLQRKYTRAAEITQRFDNKIAENDNTIITNFQHCVNDLNQSLTRITRGLSYLEVSIEDLFDILGQRLHFHRVKGLEKVEYIMEHDFVRGWTIIEERTLPYLTFGFYELRASYRWVINKLQNSMNSTGHERLLALAAWDQMEYKLLEKLDILQRASDNITEVHNAYKTGEPLLTYKASVNRRYDMTWITTDLLRAKIKDKGYDQDEYYEKIFWRMGQINQTLHAYLDMGRNVIETGTINGSLWDDTDWLFRKGCVQYNYYVFLYKDRIVNGPVDVIKERIKEFELVRRRLFQARDSLLTGATTIRVSIATVMKSSWSSVIALTEDAVDYITDSKKMKIDLARNVLSEPVNKATEEVKQFLLTLRTSGLTLEANIRRLQYEVEQVWVNMLNEYTTGQFYRRLHEDYVAFLNDSAFYITYFADLLDIEIAEFLNLSATEIEYRLNADFNTINIQDKKQAIENGFAHLRNWTSISRILLINDKTFVKTLENYKASVRNFMHEVKVDKRFYLNNFIQLDVFMQELSYEEITQQHAYDSIKLIGDIGGSVGLFLGASVLSLAELIDVCIWQLLHLSFRNN